jgi:5-carboxymethyl-2-hydroxymuconate isomerase
MPDATLAPGKNKKTIRINMPHLIIEYSGNVRSMASPAELTRIGHKTMIDSGLFSIPDIKSRAYEAADYLVGEKGSGGSFVHVRVYLLEGRSTQQKQNLSEALRTALKVPLEKIDQLSIDIRELAKETYRKYVG